MSRLSIIDWGIGGIGVLKLIKERHPDIPVTYFSDTGATPYGKMTRDDLSRRLDQVIAYLKTGGVTHLLIGCNAASTAIDDLSDHGVEIEGVISNAVELTTKLNPARLGLIGGRRTVLSGVYRRAFAKHGVKVRQRVAQPLSGLIESGDVASDRLRSECKKILGPLRNCSHVLLACTHYPAVAHVLRVHLDTETVLVDPAAALADIAGSWALTSEGDDRYLTTGDPNAMTLAAFAAFGWRITGAEKVRV